MPTVGIKDTKRSTTRNFWSTCYEGWYICEMIFGQKEKLVTRLKGLLKDYPKDQSVLNELLQNADDAGATEIHFVYDLRQVHTDQFFDKKSSSSYGKSFSS
jgi:hypothetical protein